jgi:queuine tRNA-ribosyltransferase
VIETPVFMPVGTQGSVKTVSPDELVALGAQVILGNTYHLAVRPGMEVMRGAGGLHAFANWPHPILTDSGGFQVFSLRSLRKITEEGVRFRSPIDGADVRLTPEDSMDVQLKLHSDIAMALDDCTPYPATEEEARASMERSMRWAARSHEHYYKPRENGPGESGKGEPPGGLFGIVQGGMHSSLRLASLEALMKLDFPGLAVGGLAVGVGGRRGRERDRTFGTRRGIRQARRHDAGIVGDRRRLIVGRRHHVVRVGERRLVHGAAHQATEQPRAAIGRVGDRAHRVARQIGVRRRRV